MNKEIYGGTGEGFKVVDEAVIVPIEFWGRITADDNFLATTPTRAASFNDFYNKELHNDK